MDFASIGFCFQIINNILSFQSIILAFTKVILYIWGIRYSYWPTLVSILSVKKGDRKAQLPFYIKEITWTTEQSIDYENDMMEEPKTNPNSMQPLVHGLNNLPTNYEFLFLPNFLWLSKSE